MMKRLLTLFFLLIATVTFAETAQDWQYYKGDALPPWASQIDKDQIQQLPPSKLGTEILLGTPTPTPTPTT
jgi:hypothetical protein